MSTAIVFFSPNSKNFQRFFHSFFCAFFASCIWRISKCQVSVSPFILSHNCSGLYNTSHRVVRKDKACLDDTEEVSNSDRALCWSDDHKTYWITQLGSDIHKTDFDHSSSSETWVTSQAWSLTTGAIDSDQMITWSNRVEGLSPCWARIRWNQGGAIRGDW